MSDETKPAGRAEAVDDLRRGDVKAPTRVTVPATRCVAECPECRLPFEHLMFFASFSDFATFYGTRTGTSYRLDLAAIHYGKCSREDALAPAIAIEGDARSVIELPETLFCPHCNHVVPGSGGKFQKLGTTQVEAVLLPSV